MTNTFVSVIIPTYNDWYRLSLCLDALTKQSVPGSQFEIIVVNNNPRDEQPKDFLLPVNCVLLTESKSGSYAARNSALKLAKGEIIAFTDSDCIPHVDWIKNAVRHFNTNSDCMRIAGNVVLFPKSGKASVAEKYDKLYYFQQQDHAKYLGTSVTANMFTYRFVFDKIGWFNESKLSCGDIDWGKAAHAAGFKIQYVGDVIVYHPARDLADLIKKEKRLTGGLHMVARQNHVRTFLKFLQEVRPRLGEYKAIRNRGRDLSSRDAFSILLLRYLLQYVRSYERMKLQLGKRPNRE